MKYIPLIAILAITITHFTGIPFGLIMVIAFLIEVFIGLKKAINAPDEDERIKALDVKSMEYMSRYMPKN